MTDSVGSLLQLLVSDFLLRPFHMADWVGDKRESTQVLQTGGHALAALRQPVVEEPSRGMDGRAQSFVSALQCKSKNSPSK